MNPLHLEFKALSKRYGNRTILDEIDLAIHSGECSLICGNNGEGKTTLLRIIAGLQEPDKGFIDLGLGNISWKKCRQVLQKNTVYLHQQPYMFDCSVKKNLSYVLPELRLSKKESSHRLQQALELAQIQELAEAQAKTLSGGEQQRVALARAWLRQPRILLLDEPTANMDQDSRVRTLNLLERLKSQDLALFIASHDPGQFSTITDLHLHLHSGKLSNVSMAPFQSSKVKVMHAA